MNDETGTRSPSGRDSERFTPLLQVSTTTIGFIVETHLIFSLRGHRTPGKYTVRPTLNLKIGNERGNRPCKTFLVSSVENFLERGFRPYFRFTVTRSLLGPSFVPYFYKIKKPRVLLLLWYNECHM